MINKKFIFIFLALCTSASLWGQSAGTLKLKIVDESSKAGIVMVSVQITDPSGNKSNHFTDDDGSLTINGLMMGSYTLSARTMGYADLEKSFEMSYPTLDLGSLAMKATSTVLKEYVVEGTAMRTSQKGDTVSYNAAAFKVSADANTELLLSKMPGITVGSDGSITAQGETIGKVFVDGKEFFGDDVSSAVKNLPAEIVDRVEVFNKLSDQAEFSGFDDGEGYKAINIVTQGSKRTGQFGKMYGAYGIPNKYLLGGNMNIFNGSSRLSIIGLVNNVNQQNFSFEDIAGVTGSTGSFSGGGMMMGGGPGGRGNDMRTFMVRPQDGISTVQSIGLNLSDTWGKKDRLDFSGSLFFGHTKNTNDQTSETWDFTRQNETWYTESTGFTKSHNYNARFNAKIDYKINDNNSIMVRPSFSYQNYASSGRAESSQEVRDGQDNTIEHIRTETSFSDSEREAYNAGLFAMYRTRLGKAGRTLTINGSGFYSKNDNFSEPSQYFVYSDPAISDTLFKRQTVNDTYSYRLRGGITYTEPIGEYSQLSAEYNARYNFSDADRRTYRWDEILAQYDPDYDPTLSSIYNSGYFTQSIGPGYRLAANKVNLSSSVLYQDARLHNQQISPGNSDNRYSFQNVLYRAMLRINFNPANSLNLRLSSYTSTPSASQLMTTPDMSDTENITVGNPSLRPTYNNRFNIFYVNSNVSKGTTFTLALAGTLSNNYITNSTTTDPNAVIPNSGGLTLGQGNKLVEYVNMAGYWNTFIYASYGFPLKAISSNLNFDVRTRFGETPSIMNGRDTKMLETYYGGGATLGSNISENIDFTLRYSGSYNVTNSRTTEHDNVNKFVEHYARASLKWVIWQGITFTGDATYNLYRGITNDYKENYMIVNLYVGKKIFRNNQGEISVGINDLLNQNTSFRRTVRSQSISNTTNSAIGRYVAFQFVYNLRSFGKGKSAGSTGADGYGTIEPNTGGVGIQRSSPGGPGGMGGHPPMRF